SNPTIGSNPLTGKTQWYGYDANGNRKCWKVDDRGHPVSPDFGIPGLAALAWFLVISLVVGAVLVSYGYAQVMVVAAIILLFGVALTVVSPWIGVPFLIVVIIGLVKAVTG